MQKLINFTMNRKLAISPRLLRVHDATNLIIEPLTNGRAQGMNYPALSLARPMRLNRSMDLVYAIFIVAL